MGVACLGGGGFSRLIGLSVCLESFLFLFSLVFCFSASCLAISSSVSVKIL